MGRGRHRYQQLIGVSSMIKQHRRNPSTHSTRLLVKRLRVSLVLQLCVLFQRAASHAHAGVDPDTYAGGPRLEPAAAGMQVARETSPLSKYPDPQLFNALSLDEVEYLNKFADEAAARGLPNKLNLNAFDPSLDVGVKQILEKVATLAGYEYVDIRSKFSLRSIIREQQAPSDEKGKVYHVDLHNDACCEEDCSYWYRRYGDGRQRRAGVIVWLNAEYEGGYTEFPNFGLSIKGPPGWALKFDALEPGTLFCHDDGVHKGGEVLSGMKRTLLFFVLAPMDWMEGLPGPPGFNATFAREALHTRHSVVYPSF